MRALLAGLLFSAVLFTGAAQASAQSSGDQAALLARLQVLLQALNVHLGKATLSAMPAADCTFAEPLGLGSAGPSVACLQKRLSLDASVYANGKISGYFDSLTESAVKRYQAKNGIVSSGTPTTTGYGFVGLKTRAALFGQVVPPPPPPTDPSDPDPEPTCSFAASPARVAYGGSSALGWSTQNATAVSIDRTIGSVSPAALGSRSVSPTVTTSYTLTATGSGGTVRCVTTVTVDAPTSRPISSEAYFNGSDGNTTDPTLENALMRIIGEAKPGSVIRGSMYSWTRSQVADALKRAKDRGVDVRIIRGADSGPINEKLIRDLGSENVIACGKGCIGSTINHNKFFLFSELADGSKDVVLQSSANLTNAQLRLRNNTLVIRNDGALYDAYSGYWSDLSERRKDPSYYRVVPGTGTTRAYFFPMRSGDAVADMLAEVDCTEGGTVRMAEAKFHSNRRPAANELIRLAREGCSVEVVTGGSEVADSAGADALQPESSSSENAFYRYLRDGGVEVRTAPGVHSKYYIAQALMRGSEGRQSVVWTGSHNLSGNSLRSADEAVIQVRGVAIYNAFLTDWNDIRSRAR